MGKKITEVRNKSKEGGESFKKGAEQGRKAVSDVKQMKRLIDSLPTDVDDEIITAAKAVEQGTKGDAEHYMQSEVGSKIESGRKSMDASNKQASEQVKTTSEYSRFSIRWMGLALLERMHDLKARAKSKDQQLSSTKLFKKIRKIQEKPMRSLKRI